MATISSGMSMTGLAVPAGSVLTVLSGGRSTSTGIAGQEVLSGGTDVSGTVSAGGSQTVSGGGSASAGQVNAGGTQTISSGGLASATSVGGTEAVLAGGTTSNSVLEEGLGGYGAATEAVAGRAVATVVSSGGTLLVLGGGVASAGIVSAYGMETVSSGGSGLLGTITASGALQVMAGGLVSGALVLGSELVSGGTDSGSTISGKQLVAPGGRTVSDTVAAAGSVAVGAMGTVSAVLDSGLLTLNGGLAEAVRVASGGSLALSGGTASATLVAGGGTVLVSSGHVSGSVLSSVAAGLSGAAERVLSGGTATGTKVGAGAEQIVAGGTTTGTVVLSGGVQSLGSGGALNDLVSAGGAVVDNATLGFAQPDGGDAVFAGTLTGAGALVEYGGGTLTLAGSLSGFLGTVTIYGGTVELTSAAAAGSGAIDFNSDSAGTLLVDGDTPGNVISGFTAGDVIDLASLAYPAAGLDVSVNGDTVTLLNASGAPDEFTDGSIATLTIAGASGLLLGAESDGNSGTELAALADVTTTGGGTAWQVAALSNGNWVYTEQYGTSTTFSDGGSYYEPSDPDYVTPAATPLPSGAIIQSGPGTLVLPGYEAYALFDGTVVIAGGTVAATASTGAGITSFSFAPGASATLDITGLVEADTNTGNGGYLYSAASFAPITAIAPGDVIDLGFLPFSTALGVAPLSSGATVVDITSNGQPLVLPSTNPITISNGASIALPIASAGAYTYQLSADGLGGTDLTVTGTSAPVIVSSAAPTPGDPGPPFGNGSLENGGTTYTITDYNDGDVGVNEASGTVLDFTSSITNGGALIQSGAGTLDLGTSGGLGASGLVISGGTLELPNAYAGGSIPISFAPGADGVLLVDPAPEANSTFNNAPANAISGFSAGDAILLTPNLGSGGALGLTVSGDIVTLTEDGVPLQETNAAATPTSDGVYALDIVGASSLPFMLAAVPGSSPDQIELSAGAVVGAACYCAGTRILTDRGERAVESLAIGDLIVTSSGALRPIRWVGRRSYAGRFLAGRRELLPVLFRAGALGPALPRRDLRVSPEHAMLLDGVLVAARLLVNGTTIVRDPASARIDYVHVELDSHDTLLAEGVPSETFVDDDSRQMFHNASDYPARYPDARPCPARFCAPRVESGYVLEAIRARLDLAATG